MNAREYLLEMANNLYENDSSVLIRKEAECYVEIDSFISDLIGHIKYCDNANECDRIQAFIKRAEELGYLCQENRQGS